MFVLDSIMECYVAMPMPWCLLLLLLEKLYHISIFLSSCLFISLCYCCIFMIIDLCNTLNWYKNISQEFLTFLWHHVYHTLWKYSKEKLKFFQLIFLKNFFKVVSKISFPFQLIAAHTYIKIHMIDILRSIGKIDLHSRSHQINTLLSVMWIVKRLS